ncbi:MAG: hypothetical protein GX793_03290 [Bacteroidales bacterium]|jgi:chromosomal replication initiator protein|nr:hypothetical protein [Bacteroidales bacterium]
MRKWYIDIMKQKITDANNLGRKTVSFLMAISLAEDFIEFLKFRAIEKPPTFEIIDRVVSETFQISLEQLRERTRDREVATARHLAMWFYKKYYPTLSYKQIGKMLSNGKKSFTASTTINAMKNIKNLYETDETYRKIIDDTELLIKYSELRK